MGGRLGVLLGMRVRGLSSRCGVQSGRLVKRFQSVKSGIEEVI